MIIIKKYNLNLMDMYLYVLLLTLYSTCSSFIMLIFENNTKNNINAILNMDKLPLLKASFTSFPIFMLNTITYIDLDIIINQILNGTVIIFHLLYSIIINNNKEIINWKLFLCCILNAFGCVILFIFNDFNNVKIGFFGLFLTLLLLNLKGYIYAILEKFTKDVNAGIDENTFRFLTLFFPQLCILVLLFPVFYIIQIIYYDNYNINFCKFSVINLFASLIGIINGPYYLITNISLIKLSSLDNGIINSIYTILMVFIAIIFGYSEFNYISIVSLFLIIISSICLFYLQNRLNNNSVMPH